MTVAWLMSALLGSVAVGLAFLIAPWSAGTAEAWVVLGLSWLILGAVIGCGWWIALVDPRGV